MNTMPQRDTVAGVAAFKSGTSNIILMVAGIGILSPLVKNNILLWSITVFMLSIQNESTGPEMSNLSKDNPLLQHMHLPSSTIHFLAGEGSSTSFRISYKQILVNL
jgi:hypothetical protein